MHIVLRLLVSGYFLFSAINKVFFFKHFSAYLSDFFRTGDGLAPVMAACVILAEFAFALALVLVDARRVMRIAALCISVPFIIYNAYIAFVLGLQSCHCSFSPSGESLTTPVFSILVLCITILVAWVSVQKTDISMLARGAILFILMLLLTGANFWIWHQWNTAARSAFSMKSTAANQAAETATPVEAEVFLNLPKGNIGLTARFLTTLLNSIETPVAVYMPEELVDSARADTIPTQVFSLESTSDLEGISVQIYLNRSAIYRKDGLQEMTDWQYQQIVEAIAGAGSALECERQQVAKSYARLADSLFSGDNESTEATITLIMERKCAECDADLLAWLGSVFADTERFTVRLLYVLDEENQEEQAEAATMDPFAPVFEEAILHPTDLPVADLACAYPNKLLLFQMRTAARIVAVPDNIGRLDADVQQLFEEEGISLY